jgi:hypothetical protein
MLSQIRSIERIGLKGGQYYQSLIGVLHWVCEVGRLDILVAVLIRYVVSPSEGHLLQVFHIFAYFKHHKWSWMVFDDSDPFLTRVCSTFVIGLSSIWMQQRQFLTMNQWSEGTRWLHLALLTQTMLIVKSWGICTCEWSCFWMRLQSCGIQSITIWSRCPLLVQNFVQWRLQSTWSKCFVFYKLQMMGIPLAGPTSVFCDNESPVVKGS